MSSKERFSIQLVNYEKDRQKLQGKAYMPYLDLAVLFCTEKRERDQMIFCPLSEKILTKQTAEQIMQEVIRDMQIRHPAVIYDMKEWLADKLLQAGLQKELLDLMAVPEILQGERQYYLTDREGVFGSAVILYPDVLHNFAKRLGVRELILLASSRGVFIVPKLEDRKHELQRWQKMLSDFNRDNREEFLTEHVYLYQADIDRLSIWKCVK